MTATEYITLISAAVSAVGAMIAAVASWLSARATTRAAEAQLFSSQYSDYGQAEMLTALRVLRMWRADNGEEFAKKWKSGLDAHDSSSSDADIARRHVKFYFFRALRTYEAGFISKKFLKEIGNVDGINILFDIVEPLEAQLNAKYDKASFDKLRRICGRARTGELLPPVPPPSGWRQASDG